jgi:hypothetical protein
MHEPFQTPASVTVRRRLAQVRSTHVPAAAWSWPTDERDWGKWLPAAGRGIAQCWRSLIGAQARRSPDRDSQLGSRLNLAGDPQPALALSTRPLSPWVRAYESPDLPWQWG